jgi:pimeloyl-ACP methyl ester carboxylesterase
MGLRVRGVKPDYLLLERLGELKMPVMVAWGQKDQILPDSNVEKIRKVLPNARYELFPNAGHMITYEEPERFNAALIDFLRDR